MNSVSFISSKQLYRTEMLLHSPIFFGLGVGGNFDHRQELKTSLRPSPAQEDERKFYVPARPAPVSDSQARSCRDPQVGVDFKAIYERDLAQNER